MNKISLAESGKSAVGEDTITNKVLNGVGIQTAYKNNIIYNKSTMGLNGEKSVHVFQGAIKAVFTVERNLATIS